MKTIKERVEVYRRYTHENILLAFAETEELMIQVSRATTLEMAQELARAWLLVFNSDQVPPMIEPDSVTTSAATTAPQIVFYDLAKNDRSNP